MCSENDLHKNTQTSVCLELFQLSWDEAQDCAFLNVFLDDSCAHSHLRTVELNLVIESVLFLISLMLKFPSFDLLISFIHD
jgi:hypothetical protein